MELVIVIVLAVGAFLWISTAAVKRVGDQNSDQIRARGEDAYREIFTQPNVVYTAGPGQLSLEEITAAAGRYGYDVTSVGAPEGFGHRQVVMVRRADAPDTPVPPPSPPEPDAPDRDDGPDSTSWWWRPAR